MLSKGRYQLRAAVSPADLSAAQDLRHLCFGQAVAWQIDPVDTRSLHFLVEERESAALVCCFRLLPLNAGALAQSYAAQFYDLSALETYPGLMMELGRFCIHPDWRDPDILRLAWAGMTREVDHRGVEMLFGCSSFEGVDWEAYAEAFALLSLSHQAPARWRPREKADEVFRYHQAAPQLADRRTALRALPSLLRTYLVMGGWVSDHAVVDRQMNTLHVFTGLEIAAIPLNRKRLLRALI